MSGQFEMRAEVKLASSSWWFATRPDRPCACRPTAALRAAACLVPLVLIGCRSPEQSVRPGINDPYVNADAGVWTERLESESREIYTHRERIVSDLRLAEGMDVADVGSGTGFFTILIGRAVGPNGQVYAVDIVPSFLELTRRRAAEAELTNIREILSSAQSVNLPPDSVDLVFVCDTYHHFEYPVSTLASIHRALRPGGQLVVIDFERIPGVSRDWVIDHVRAGREVVVSEIEEAGFELLDNGSWEDYLAENYFLRFRRR